MSDTTLPLTLALNQVQSKIKQKDLLHESVPRPYRTFRPAICSVHRVIEERRRSSGDVLRRSIRLETDRMALAAHGLRELMEKLPRFHDLPKETKPTAMTAMVRVLTASWGNAVGKSNCHSNGIWSGEIDRALERFLKKAQEFFGWIEKERPTRKQAAARILRNLIHYQGRSPLRLKNFE